MKHLIEVNTDTHPGEDRQAEFEQLREYLMDVGTWRGTEKEIEFTVTQVRLPSGLSQP